MRGFRYEAPGQSCVITGGASWMGRATTYFQQYANAIATHDTGKQTLLFPSGLVTRFGSSALTLRKSRRSAMMALAIGVRAARHRVQSGVGGVLGPVWDIDVEEWDYTFDVLAKGVFLGIKHAAREMKRLGSGGSIINTASVAGLSGGSGPLVYSAAKAAVINLTRAAALQLAPDRIRVNAICPGGVLTPRSWRPRRSRKESRPIPAMAGAREAGAYRGRCIVSGRRRFRVCHRRGTGGGRRPDCGRAQRLARIDRDSRGSTLARRSQSRQHRRPQHKASGPGALSDAI